MGTFTKHALSSGLLAGCLLKGLGMLSLCTARLAAARTQLGLNIR